MSTGIKSVSEGGDESGRDRRTATLVASLGTRSVVLVGIMGCGKTSTGRRLAQRLGLDFVDADVEIEWAAGMTISEIFSRYGEAYFRDGERRVMARLLADGPRVIATGGGAFMHDETRARVAEQGVSVWLKADFDVLWRRVRKRTHRPLLQNPDSENTLRLLMEQRYPIYARADVIVCSRDGPHETVVENIVDGLEFFLRFSPEPPASLDAEKPVQPAAKPMSKFEKVGVKLGARSYNILIGDGLIGEAGKHIRRLAPGAACAIVTDENVARYHLPLLEEGLKTAEVKYSVVIVPPGEGSKSYPRFETVCDSIIGARLERGDFVIALGGGVVGDLAGFAAASIRRGMRFVQIPTTLLAQVDSSVGGKTGINSPHGKNLVGAFHQPSLVLADTSALETLPKREFQAGYAEIVKYGLIGDASLFAWLETNWSEIFAGGAARIRAIAKSCAAKAAVVCRDEREDGDRALLNFGHTFGHAFERIVHYDGVRLVHGEGVAIGMACAMRFSAQRGLCGDKEADRVEMHLREVGLPVHIRDIAGWDANAETIVDAMYQDKKVQHGSLTFILARGIGKSFIAKNVDPAEVLAFLRDELNHRPNYMGN
jgi:shikimate kinase/3-dehydroquinate synthase